MRLIGIFLAILCLQFALNYCFTLIGINNYYIVDTLTNVVLAFFFAIIYYRGPKKEAFKDLYFHRSVASYFVLLMLFSLLYWFVF